MEKPGTRGVRNLTTIICLFIFIGIIQSGCGDDSDNTYLSVGEQIKTGQCIENHFGGKSSIDMDTLTWAPPKVLYDVVTVWDKDTIDGPVNMVEYIKNHCL